jgi:hypothetical protein
MELAAERFMEAAQGHWVLSSQEEHSCDSFAERVQPSNWSAYDSVFEERLQRAGGLCQPCPAWRLTLASTWLHCTAAARRSTRGKLCIHFDEEPENTTTVKGIHTTIYSMNTFSNIESMKMPSLN